MEMTNLFRRLVYYQVLLGILASCMAGREPVLLLVAGTLGTLSWYVVEGPTGRPLPRWVTLIGTLLATAYLAYEIHVTGGHHLVYTLVHYTIWLQLVLLYTLKSNRECAQLLVLSMLQMISASVVSASMVFGLLLAVYCVLALFTVLLFQLKASSDLVQHHNQQAAPPGQRAAIPKPVICRGYHWQFRVTTISTGFFCALIAAAVFLLSPRTPPSQFRFGLEPPLAQHKSGFRTQVSLRYSLLNDLNHEPVLNLKLSDGHHTHAHPQRSWLMRGAVMDHYSLRSQTWMNSLASSSYDVQIDLSRGGKTLMKLPGDTRTLHAEITLLNAMDRHLFTLDLPVAFVDSANVRSVRFNPYCGRLTTNKSLAGPLVYRLRSPQHLPHGVDLIDAYGQNIAIKTRRRGGTRPHVATSDRVPDTLGSQCARGWPVQPLRVRELASQVLTDQGIRRDLHALYYPNDVQACRAIEAYLRETGGFEYAMNVPFVAAGKDPVIEILFSHRRGHCELFASAMAAMV